MRQEQFAEPTAENINVGMMVTLPTEPGEKVTVYDIFFANDFIITSHLISAEIAGYLP